MKTCYVFLLLLLIRVTATAQCGFNNNVPTYFPAVTPQAQNESPQLLGYPDVGTYITLHIVKGLNYQIYTHRDNLTSQLRLDVYDIGTQQLLTSATTNTGNPAGAAAFNVALNWEATISGTVRININDAASCSITDPHGIPVSIILSGSNTLDDPAARGQSSFTGTTLTGTWIEHVYDEPALTVANLPAFTSYIGYNVLSNQLLPASAATYGFNQDFLSSGNPDYYPYTVQSNGQVEASVLTASFSARYRTAMTLCGTYRFRVYCDDGARVYLNNSLVLDDWTDHGAEYTDWYTITDYCGTYLFDIEYYENAGDNILRFEMEKISGSGDAVPPVINHAAIPAQSVAGTAMSFAIPSLAGLVRSATLDNQTPVNDLMITQTPSAGTIVQDPQADVSLTVEDLAGNSASTVIRVTNTNYGTLPLRLLLFEGSNNGQELQFYWKTAEEQQVSYIELMEAEDGVLFKPVLRLQPKGKDYNEYTCRLPAPSAAAVRYRLRITDKDGTVTWSKTVIPARSSASSPFRFSVSNEGGLLWLKNQSDYTGTSVIRVYNVSGQRIADQSLYIEKSARIRLLAGEEIAGVYIVTIGSADGRLHQSIKVMR